MELICKYLLVLQRYYTLYSGLMEAELEDWKDGRMVRLVGVDQGNLAYVDVPHTEDTFVLVTWPPRWV